MHNSFKVCQHYIVTENISSIAEMVLYDDFIYLLMFTVRDTNYVLDTGIYKKNQNEIFHYNGKMEYKNYIKIISCCFSLL